MSARRLLAILVLVVGAVSLLAFAIVRTPAPSTLAGITVGGEHDGGEAWAGTTGGTGPSDAGTGASGSSDGGGSTAASSEDGGPRSGVDPTEAPITLTPVPSRAPAPSPVPTRTATVRPPADPIPSTAPTETAERTGSGSSQRTARPPRSDGVCEWDDDDGDWDCDTESDDDDGPDDDDDDGDRD